MKREDVYKLIDDERMYQNSLGADRRSVEQHSVGDYVTMLHHYMNLLDAAWTQHSGTLNATNVIRKIAGIAVRCMEEHGAPARSKDFDLGPGNEKLTMFTRERGV